MLIKKLFFYCSIFITFTMTQVQANNAPSASKSLNTTPSNDPRLVAVADDFQEQFSQYLYENKVPGAVFAIVSKDGFSRIGTYGYTDLSRKRAIDENTVFRIASLSKTFAATLTGILVQNGVLTWDDYVVKHSSVLGRAGLKKQMKIKHLLGQASGFQAYAYDMQIEDGFSYRRILSNIRRLPLRCRPGKCYAYTNSVFSAIDPILKQITNKSYQTLLQENIFDPLKMDNASASYEKLMINQNRAEPHEWKKGEPQQVDNKPNYYRVNPAAGINASVQDMARYLEAQIGMHPDFLTEKTRHIVSRPRVRTKRDLHKLNWKNYITDAHYGIGWRNYNFMGNEVVYHGGWVSGFRSDIAYSKKHGVGIVVMLNIEGKHTSYLTTQFLNHYFRSLSQPAPSNFTAN